MTPELQAAGATSRELVLRFAPPTDRARLQALFDIEHEILASLRPDLDHNVAHTRLEWWSEELTGLTHASARHPSTRALAEASLTAGLSLPDLRGLIEATRIDLATVAFLNQAELDDYLALWADTVFACVCRTASEQARLLGKYIREIELLADWPLHAPRGRLYRALGDPPEAHTRWVHHPLGELESARLRARLHELAVAVRALANASSLDTLPLPAPALLWGTLAHGTAMRLQARLPDFSITRFEPLSRTMRAWRAAVSLARGYLPSALR